MNDNAPIFTPKNSYNFTYIELQDIGSPIGYVNTTDRDGPGPNSQVRSRSIVTYSLHLAHTVKAL